MTVHEMKSLVHQIPTDSINSLGLLIRIEQLNRGIAPPDNVVTEAAKSRLLDENACFDGLFDKLAVPFMSDH
jgi:hypothetical protein